MKLSVFSIYDVKAKIYSRPFTMVHNGEALRAFSDTVNDPKSGLLHKYPEDYRLFKLAEFDDTIGVYTPMVNGPEFIAHATDFVKKEGDVTNG